MSGSTSPPRPLLGDLHALLDRLHASLADPLRDERWADGARALIAQLHRVAAAAVLAHEVEMRHVRQCALEDALEFEAQAAMLQRRGVLESAPDALARANALAREIAAETPHYAGASGRVEESFVDCVNALLENVE